VRILVIGATGLIDFDAVVNCAVPFRMQPANPLRACITAGLCFLVDAMGPNEMSREPKTRQKSGQEIHARAISLEQMQVLA